MNVYSNLDEFLRDMELVFSNCKTYNGTESHVGQIGVRIHNEYQSLLKNYKLKERFEGENYDFHLSENVFEGEGAIKEEAIVEELSDSELPQDSIPQMNARQEIPVENPKENQTSAHNSPSFN